LVGYSEALIARGGRRGARRWGDPQGQFAINQRAYVPVWPVSDASYKLAQSVILLPLSGCAAQQFGRSRGEADIGAGFMSTSLTQLTVPRIRLIRSYS
jgi:hypothetical protein